MVTKEMPEGEACGGLGGPEQEQEADEGVQPWGHPLLIDRLQV